ncbi:hypothetical protein ACTFIR_011817 [Dictyostelium discoideum]
MNIMLSRERRKSWIQIKPKDGDDVINLEVDESEKEQPEEDQTSPTTMNKMNIKRFRATISAQQLPNKQKQVDPNQYIPMGDTKKLEKDQQHGEDEKLNDLNQKELFTKEQLENITNLDKEKAVLDDGDDQEMEQDDGDEDEEFKPNKRQSQVLLAIDDTESMTANHVVLMR